MPFRLTIIKSSLTNNHPLSGNWSICTVEQLNIGRQLYYRLRDLEHVIDAKTIDMSKNELEKD